MKYKYFYRQIKTTYPYPREECIKDTVTDSMAREIYLLTNG